MVKIVHFMLNIFDHNLKNPPLGEDPGGNTHGSLESVHSESAPAWGNGRIVSAVRSRQLQKQERNLRPGLVPSQVQGRRGRGGAKLAVVRAVFLGSLHQLPRFLGT